jgi:hypothetical protein
MLSHATRKDTKTQNDSAAVWKGAREKEEKKQEHAMAHSK